jgi:hypothetical protein
MVAALLGNTPSVLRSIPEIKDVDVVSSLLEIHGVSVEWDKESGRITMDPAGVKSALTAEIDAHAGDSRIPILFCGPLLHRLGATRADEARNVGAQQRVALAVGQAVVPGAHERADHRTRALGVVAPRLAGDEGHGLHHTHGGLV